VDILAKEEHNTFSNLENYDFFTGQTVFLSFNKLNFPNWANCTFTFATASSRQMSSLSSDSNQMWKGLKLLEFDLVSFS
jgi:hypothetical protein